MERSPVLRSPHWEALVGLLDEVCHQKGLLRKSGHPSDTQLGRACRVRPDVFNGWRRHQRPSRRVLETLAQYVGQEVGPWLRAGGFEEQA